MFSPSQDKAWLIKRILTLICCNPLETFVLGTQRKKVTRAHDSNRKMLTIGTALPPLQRSLSQHLYEHSPPASLQAFNSVLASSQRALVEQVLVNDLVSPTLGILNLMESVAQ